MTAARRLLLPALTVFAALVVAPLAVACGGADRPAVVESLVGRRFVAVAASGFDLPAASSLAISFDEPQGDPGADGRIGVSGGCNLIGGAFAIGEGDTLVSLGGWIQTEMACDEPLMALDAAVVELLDSAPVLRLEGTTLTIGAGATTLRLEQE